MPPTTPTAVDATATQSNVAEANATVTVETGSADLTRATATTSNAAALDLLVSGSKALGVAPLDGYQLAVTNDSSGATVATVKIAPKAATKSVVAQAARGTVAGKGNLVNGATGAVRNLQPGTYTLRVASYNRIGVSDPYTVKLVVQRGGKVAVVKHLTATVKHAAVSAKWAGVSGATGYVLQAVKGSKIIKTVRVGAKTRAANIKLSKGSYTLRVASLRGNRASVPVSSQVRVR